MARGRTLLDAVNAKRYHAATLGAGDGIRQACNQQRMQRFILELSPRGMIWSFDFLYSTFVISVAFCKTSLRPSVKSLCGLL
jgi:hypothetical protein